MKPWLPAAVFLCLMPISANAQEDGRYVMKETENGIIRLDTATGIVSLCKFENDALVCRTAADDRKSYEDELERLTRENEELRKGVKVDDDVALPSDEEIDEVVGTFEKFAKAIMDAIKRLEENLDDTGGAAGSSDPG